MTRPAASAAAPDWPRTAWWVGGGDVADDYAVLRRGVAIDIIVAHAGADDALTPRRPGEGRLADQCNVMEQDQGIGPVEVPGQLRLVMRGRERDPGDVAQDRGLD